MFSSDNRNTLDATLSSDKKSNEINIHKNISIINQNEINSSLQYINEKSDIFFKIEEKINHIQNDLIDNYKKQIEELKFFHIFICYFYSDIFNWKLLVHSIYHIKNLINNLNNYQIKEFIQKQFQILLNDFILFIKNLITIQIRLQKQEIKENQSSKINDTLFSINPQTTFPEINQIEQHIENLKHHIINLKELILTSKERFHICKTDIDDIQTLLQAIDNINFDYKNFNKQDQDKIHLLRLKQDLLQKSNKTDLIQLKIYIDNQIKKLIELNKQNAKELERIKLLKTSTYESRHIQTILSTNNPSSYYKKPNQIYSYQSSRPYITFELDHIRQYQRQALLKSPYGTIPLYRRQAWAAANLFHDHPLHLLRYMQNSLRMQIHHLLGYDPSNICNTNKKKKINKNSTIKIFNTNNQDILIVGNNNKLYRGSIDSCQIIPLKTKKEKKFQIKTNINENNDIIKINFDQFDQTKKIIADEYLFEYFDWQTQFNEQDLPDELYEELFQHWKSILCEDQPCICNSKSIQCEEKNNLINTHIDSSLNNIYDDRCICSECSCDCEKYENNESICLCSQCSCKCLKDFQCENQDNIEDILGIYDENILSLQTNNNLQDHLINEINIKKEFQLIPTDRISIVEQIKENKNDEIMISDCFINRIDQWTRQFDLFRDTYQSSSSLPEGNDWLTMNDNSQFQATTPDTFACNTISDPLELDDPTVFRQKILDQHRQREQAKHN